MQAGWKSLVGQVGRILRNTPWLTAIIALCGAVGALTTLQLSPLSMPGWLLWLLPAIILAWWRGGDWRRCITIVLISLGLTWWWVAAEGQRQLFQSQTSSLGEILSPEAQRWKLILVAIALLVPALAAVLYYRAHTVTRYTVRTFMTPFLLCQLGLLGIFIVIDLLDNANDYIEAKVPVSAIIKLYVLQVPQVIVETMHLALLLGALYALSRMSRYNEIISMIMAGRSLPRVLLPLVICGVFGTIIALACNYEWAPQAERLEDELRDTGRTPGRNLMYANTSERRLWYIHELPLDLSPERPMKQLQVNEWDENGHPVRVVFAREAMWTKEGGWELRQVREYQSNGGNGAQEWGWLSKARRSMPEWKETPWQLLSRSEKVRPEYLGVPELASYLTTNADFPKDQLAAFRTHWHQRLSVPVQCLIVMLIGCPLGVVFSRRGIMAGVITAICLFLGLFFCNTVLLRLGETAKIAPEVAAWTCAIAFPIIGLSILAARGQGGPVEMLKGLFSGQLLAKRR